MEPQAYGAGILGSLVELIKALVFIKPPVGGIYEYPTMIKTSYAKSIYNGSSNVLMNAAAWAARETRLNFPSPSSGFFSPALSQASVTTISGGYNKYQQQSNIDFR